MTPTRHEAPAGMDHVALLDAEAVIALSEEILTQVDAETLPQTLLRVARAHTHAEHGALFLYGDHGRACVAQFGASSVGAFSVGVGELHPNADRSCVAWAVQVLEQVVRTLQLVHLIFPSFRPGIGAEAQPTMAGIQSVLGIPLLDRGRLVGVLCLANSAREHDFTSGQIAVARLIAAQGSIAVKNSGLMLALKRETLELKVAEQAARRINSALAASEERFRAMAGATTDVIWISEAHPERLLYVNPSFERIWGISVAELYEHVHLWVEGIHPDDRVRVGSAFADWTRSGGALTWDIEFRVQQPSGAIRWIHERGVFLSDESDSPRRIGGIATDVTEHRTAVLALQQSEERHSRAMEAARDGYWDWIAMPDSFYASPRMLEIYGFPAATRFKGRKDFLARFPFAAGEREAWQTTITRFFASNETLMEYELCLIRHGELRWINLHGLVTRDNDGHVTRYTGSVSDITERKAAAQALQESEQRFALATEGSSDGIYDWDLNSSAMFLSHRCQRLFGLEPANQLRQRQDWAAAIQIHAEDVGPQRRMFRDFLAGRIPTYDKELRALHPDGSYRWIRIRGVCKRDHLNHTVRIAGSVSDIDARRRAEAAIQQMQRLEAVGTLAGGVAHDFNNILAVILGFGEASVKRTRRGSRMRRDLEHILSAGDRGRSLVERILTFSRSSVGARIVVNVESVVAESLTMIEAMAPRNVSLDFELRSGDATIVGDPTQIHQLVMNLATNAIQAMECGGPLEIRLTCVCIAEERMTTIGPLSPGDYVALSVRDGGTGIDPAIREKIFDPFYTTKDVGTGTGLGLSLVHGIVIDLRGAINVSTELNTGSCFTIYLPRSGSEAIVASAAPVPVPRGSRQRILLVDDEEALVRLSTDMLIDTGYEPRGYTCSKTALAAFHRDPFSFDAVITDSRMPQMSGVQMIKALRAIRSDVPILLVSGFLSGPAAAEARSAGANLILHKPVSQRELAFSLWETLGEAGFEPASAT